MFRMCLVVVAAALSTGCASIVSGQNQSVSVVAKNNGADVSGAKCQLSNDKGTWFATTPGSVTVRRSFNDLAVNCALDGMSPGLASVKSSTKGMAFGNILLGGVFGAGVDMSTGAAYDYPDIIAIEMGQTLELPVKPAEPVKAAAEPAKKAEPSQDPAVAKK